MKTTFGQRHYKFLAPNHYNEITKDLPEVLNATWTYKRLVTDWLLDKGNQGSETLLTNIV